VNSLSKCGYFEQGAVKTKIVPCDKRTGKKLQKTQKPPLKYLYIQNARGNQVLRGKVQKLSFEGKTPHWSLVRDYSLEHLLVQSDEEHYEESGDDPEVDDEEVEPSLGSVPGLCYYTRQHVDE